MSRELPERIIKGILSYSFKHPKNIDILSFLYCNIIYTSNDTSFRLIRKNINKGKDKKYEIRFNKTD